MSTDLQFCKKNLTQSLSVSRFFSHQFAHLNFLNRFVLTPIYSFLLVFGVSRCTWADIRPQSLSASQKTTAVLNRFEAWDGTDYSGWFENLSQDKITAQTRVKILDPNSQWARFLTLNGLQISLFQDFDDKQILESSLPILEGPADQLNNKQELPLKLQSISLQSESSQPLAGLKVALDPGHMGSLPGGSKIWDQRTGKYIHSGNSYLSEGLLALQTTLILKKYLEDLGAQVMVTRDDVTSVSTLPYQDLNISQFAKIELRSSTLDSWFIQLLSQTQDLQKLYGLFQSNANFQALYSESMRQKYYVNREDLEARIQLINQFEPDLTLIVHYDIATAGADGHGVAQSNIRRTKAYVAGAFEKTEFSSRSDRAHFTRILLDNAQWEGSFKLASHCVQNLTKDLALTPDSNGGGSSIQLNPGIFARNLALTRKITHSALAYLEILYYNSPDEFQILQRQDQFINIHGQKIGYSNQLDQIAGSIKNAILQTIQDYKTL